MPRRARKVLPGEDKEAQLRAYLIEARENHELQLLSLRAHNIGDDIARTVSGIIQEHPSLTELDLREAIIGVEGQKTIGEAITRSDITYITCDGYSLTEGVQTLDVSGRGLSAIDCIIFSGALMNNSTLTELDLSSNELGAPVYPRGWSYQPEAAYKEKYFHNDGRRQMEEPEGTKPGGALAFAAALEQSGSLTKLNITGNGIDDESKVEIGHAIEKGGRIAYLQCDEWSIDEDTTELDVNHENLSEADATLLNSVLRNNTNMLIVNALGNHIGADQARVLITLAVNVETLLSSTCGLQQDAQEADFSGVHLKPVDALLIAADVPSKGSMTSLTFGKDNNVRDVVHMQSSDTEADFSRKGMRPSGAIILASFLPKYQALTKITFAGDFGDSVTLDTTMTSVDLSGKMIGSAGAIVAAAFIPKFVLAKQAQLSDLNIANNNITSTGAEALANGLKDYTPLTRLNIRDNKLTLGHKRAAFDGTLDWHYEKKNDGVIALANAIVKAKGLTELDIASNSIGAAGAKAFSKSTKLLSKLDMSNNDLGGWPDKSGLKALSNCIAVSTSLQDLDVSLNDLRGEDSSILAEALITNGSLTKLEMAGNPVRDAGGEAMARALVKNSALTELNMSNHRVPIAIQKEIRQACASKGGFALRCGAAEEYHRMAAQAAEERRERTIKKVR